MEKKFAKGPWVARAFERTFEDGDENDPPVEIVSADGETIACNEPYYPTALDTKNAHLIAAAPCLLEALEAAIECGMVPVSSVSDGGAAKYSRQIEVADMIRAAINKALGKS